MMSITVTRIGSSKELLETVLKAVLGLHGSGPETKRDIPQLIKQANVKLGLDAAGVRGDDPGAAHRRKLLGSLSTIVNTTGELRNAGLGTGHGLSVGPTLDVASARLVAPAATAVATFYIEAYAVHNEAAEVRGASAWLASPPCLSRRYAHADGEAKVRIDTLELIESTLGRRQLRLVLAWAELHRDELAENWRRARAGERLREIEPLR